MGPGLNLLLDTHALIWWLAGDDALSLPAHEAIADETNSIAVSAASAMEIATKFRIGKLAQAALLAQDFEAIVAAQGFTELPISIRHAAAVQYLPPIHRDPFDRLLVAQAINEPMHLLTADSLLQQYSELVRLV